MIDTLSILVLLLALGGPIAIAQIGQRSVAGATRLSLNLLLQLLLTCLAITCLWIALGPLRVPASDLGLGLPDLHTWLWGGAMSVFFIFGLGPILLRMPLWLGLKGFEKTLSALADLPIWYLVLAVVVGGIVEELLYRGIALAVLTSLGLDPILAATFVVTAFALAHIPMWGIGPALTTAISGAALTAFFLWHGDLLANIIAHVVTDFAGIVLGPLFARLRR
ncbi:CPBP family intramembrane metalloprotease [Fontisubflavum oceani]|uniref:CPBP family intramembrane glutamic endopeptidase n=1 Tax=Fontisubflavum oceani TaxID=2978973 RepID=UPI0025B3311D|nr:CPBP family intramembrane glutamic endopeptidase [Fontisubflavum oceani]WJY21676.1 CPBP family intramembrane metalloprotease [Fontisubflavum oceani]